MMRVLWLMCFILIIGDCSCGIAKMILFQDGNTYCFENTDDTLVYTNNRHLEYFKQLRNYYNGLPPEDVLDDFLNQQDYILVLNYLWSEENQDLRINWLEKKVAEGHAILLCELALEYVLRDPSLHTLFFFSSPLLNVAIDLTAIDSQCTTDESVSAAPGFLEYCYGGLILEQVLKHHTMESVMAYSRDHYIEYKVIQFKREREALAPLIDPKQSLSMPSPSWVFSHGIGAFSKDYPEYEWDEWDAIRRNAAQKILIMILEAEEELQLDPERCISRAFQEMD